MGFALRVLSRAICNPAESPRRPEAEAIGEPDWDPFVVPWGESPQCRRSATLSARARQLTPKASREKGQPVLKAAVRAIAKLAAGLVLVAILNVHPAAAAPAQQRLGSRTLSQGMTGSDVRTLQQQLTEAALKTPVTGEFDPATASSVE